MGWICTFYNWTAVELGPKFTWLNASFAMKRQAVRLRPGPQRKAHDNVGHVASNDFEGSYLYKMVYPVIASNASDLRGSLKIERLFP